MALTIDLSQLFKGKLPFSWTGRNEVTPPANKTNLRPGRVQMDGGLQSNSEMLKGLYEGSYIGLQFASPLTLTPIQTLVSLMGVPIPISQDKRTQEVLDEITEQMFSKFCKLHARSLLHGTAWRFPRYDREYGLVWEEIADTVVSDILVDIASNRVKELYTSEQISIRTKPEITENITRNRHFTLDKVEVHYVMGSFNDYTGKNVGGVLPIPFSNETDEAEIRGHSLLARILRDLKDYHDIDYRISTILAKFSPKQVQDVGNLDAWLENNFGSKKRSVLVDYDIFERDFILNMGEKEKTQYVFAPSDVTGAHENALKRKFLKIVEGTGVPEIFWGPLATGNHATTEEQWQQAIQRTEATRNQFNEAYKALYRGSLRILGVANAEQYELDDLEIRWNFLEAVNPKNKAEIFAKFASAVTTMAKSGTMTLKQLYTLWDKMYPESGITTYEEFTKDLKGMANFQHFVNSDYFSGLDDLNKEGLDDINLEDDDGTDDEETDLTDEEKDDENPIP